MRDYELVLVVSPDGGEENFPSTVERVHQFIKDRGGEIKNVDQWGRRRLAYPVQRFTEGYYNITHFAFEPQQVRALEGSLELAEDVLRHLVVRIDEAKMPPPRVTALAPEQIDEPVLDEIDASAPDVIKALVPDEMEAPVPDEIKALVPDEIKAPVPDEIEATVLNEIEAPAPDEIEAPAREQV